MSSLFRAAPEYDVEAAESAPLVNRDDDDFSAFRSGGDEDRVNVTYVFAPEWPVPGKEEQIVGVLGRDKDETVDMVQRAFPTLAKYPAGRIAFEVSDIAPSNPTTTPQQYPPPRIEWAKVMDEAWPQFKRKPPSRIRVTVKDAPGDELRRRTRDRRKLITVIAAAVISPFVLFGLLILLAYSFDSADEEV